MKKIKNLDEFLINQLEIIKYEEVYLANKIPELLKEVGNKKLNVIINEYKLLLNKRIEMIDKLFDEFEITTEDKNLKTTESILKISLNEIDSSRDKSINDIAIIFAIQSINHFKIANYEALKVISEKLEKEKLLNILKTIIIEEKCFNEKYQN